MFGWGTSDFFANISSGKIGHTKTLFWSQVAGSVFILLFLIILRPGFVTTPLLVGLTILGGVAYALGYLLFYKGFEIGNISVVSAVVNLQTLFVIFVSYFVRGQRLTTLQVPAIVLILLGVFIVSVNLSELKKGSLTLLSGVKETLLATILFGVVFTPLNEYITEQSDWLVITFITKFVAVCVVLLLSFFMKESLKLGKLPTKVLIMLVSMGVFEAVGTLGLSFGQAYGDGIIVSPIGSALTVVTVGLAVIFLKERLTKIQVVGIAAVVFGIILTAF